MPLYEYACPKCEHEFETLVFGEDEQVECPKCASTQVERRLSMPGLPVVKAGAASSPCGNPSLPPCGAPGCRRTG